MTNRERALNILRYKSADRMPAVHFGYWPELLEEWEQTGSIPKGSAVSWADGNECDSELNKLIGWDFNWCTTVRGNMSIFPAFEYKVLEKLPDGFLRVQNHDGLIERIREGAGSIPAEDDYQLKDRESFEALYKPKMQFFDGRINKDFFEKVKKDETKRENPLGIHAGSILGHIRNMMSVVGLSYMLADDYELLGEIVDTYANMQYSVVEEVLKTGAKFDFALFWEDVCFKNGPLISPVMFEELCAAHYKKRCDLLKSYGVDIISLDCDGVTDRLLPVWFEGGVNTMFPIEIGTWGDQFEPARKKFGSGLKGVGGMDKTAFRKDKAAVDSELKRLEKLVALGGFIPCPDHRIMPGSKIELVKYYAAKIKEIKL